MNTNLLLPSVRLNGSKKNRHNIILSEVSRARGEQLAEVEKRSFSNLLEVLIDNEYARIFPAAAKFKPAASAANTSGAATLPSAHDTTLVAAGEAN